MKNLYKILLVGLIFASFALARTSGKYASPESFIQSKISGSTKKAFEPSQTDNENENSVKWKRRHKRRKKDTKRKPSRGR